MAEPEIRHCASADGTQIAYTTFGAARDNRLSSSLTAQERRKATYPASMGV